MNGTENGSVKQFEKNNNVNSDKVESNLESVELMRNCGLWFAASIVIYLFWILNVSIAPVFFLLLLAAFFHEIKKDKLKRHSQAQITSTVDEKTLVENTFKPNDVPAWILFPDKERVEWINTILEMLWPKLGLMVREGIYGVVEPEIQKSLEQYGMTGFTFERVTLGQIPPRITGIKVYDKKSIRNQIAIDVDLLYTSDCDITISLKGWSSGLQGVRFRGTLRIELKPLISEAPLFGSIEAYFLSTPEFDFSLGGIANVFDVTGVSSLLKSIFMEILTKDMVFPNKLKLFEKDVGECKETKSNTTQNTKFINSYHKKIAEYKIYYNIYS